jgi:Domain of unknown function (DUF4383)
MLRKIAWLYAAGFVGVFLVTHAPGATDAEGRLFGLFRIDPIDDVVHLLSGVAGVVVAAWATRLIPLYLKLIGILYGLDALVGLVFSRGFLDGSLFTQGPGGADFGVTNILINLPHIILAGFALVIGFSSLGRSHITQPA